MWFYAFALALGLASLQIMVHQWHLSYISWGMFMIVVAGVMTFLKITSAKEFSKRDKEFDEVRTLAAGFLGARHIHHPWFNISPFDLDNLIVSQFRTEQLFKNYYDYRFQRKYTSEIIALILIMDSVSMLISTGEYHDVDNYSDKLDTLIEHVGYNLLSRK